MRIPWAEAWDTFTTTLRLATTLRPSIPYQHGTRNHTIIHLLTLRLYNTTHEPAQLSPLHTHHTNTNTTRHDTTTHTHTHTPLPEARGIFLFWNHLVLHHIVFYTTIIIITTGIWGAFTPSSHLVPILSYTTSAWHLLLAYRRRRDQIDA